MDNYVPFLKYKSNEIIALGELEPTVKKCVTPFFDYPRSNSPKTLEQFTKDVSRLSKSVKKHLSDFDEIYLDTYDLEEEHYINGNHSYFHLISSISAITEIKVIPVVSIDRSENHLKAVRRLVDQRAVDGNVLALRLTAEDFSSYPVVKCEIKEFLGELFSLFARLDIIFDNRVCSSEKTQETAQKISLFSSLFSKDYKLRKRIISGSSIPASASEILSSNSETIIEKIEINIFKATSLLSAESLFIYGDYTIVSPNYSDINVPPEMMQNITTAKLVYTYDKYHYFIRGSSLKTGGASQYFDMAKTLCTKPFFRGAIYSKGDAYFFEKSQGLGSNGAPGAVIKPSVNAHITYIVQDGFI